MAYLCRDFTCLPAITDPRELAIKMAAHQSLNIFLCLDPLMGFLYSVVLTHYSVS